MVGREALDGAILLHEGRQSFIYKVNLPAYGGEVVVKLLKDTLPESAAAGQLVNEYKLLRHLKGSGIRPVLDQVVVNNFSALIMAYAEGCTLKEYLEQYQTGLAEKLQIAINLCQLLDAVHHHCILHGNLCSDNIIIQPASLALTLIDFGLSTASPTAVIGSGMPAAGVEVAYMAPELSGKLANHADERADLYSLGVLLYELFGGSMPFEADSPQAYVHAHMALAPELLHQRHADVPPAIGAIVHKLLAKIPDDRYNAAIGAQADLEHALEQYGKFGEIEPFTLATHDIVHRLQFSTKLYGRSKELAHLQQTWEDVCNGSAELVWLAGNAGVGKSALANQVLSWAKLAGGFFARGKFDAYQNNKPYSAIINALDELIDVLLTLSETELVYWRERITDHIGKEGRLLTDMLPHLKLLIGEQPSLPVLDGPEAKNRFTYTFKNFLKALGSEKHPLVLQLDDLHWSDATTINLLAELLEDPGYSYLMLIGTYRSDELKDQHPLAVLLQKEVFSFHQHRLELTNLSSAEVDQLLAEILKTSLSEVESLGKIVYAKTKGNPFFLTQFLQAIAEAGFLWFAREKTPAGGGKWKWNEQALVQLPQTENVLKLLATRFEHLDLDSRHVLQLAACFGNQFNAHKLGQMLGPEVNTRAVWHKLLREGYVVAISSVAEDEAAEQSYRFPHDRLQEAAYQSISKEQQQQFHLQIGRFLKQLPNAQQEHFLFDIVMHLNLGQSCLTSLEIEELTRLNLQAGRKAMASVGYELAYQLLQQAILLLPATRWQSRYAFTLELTTEAANAAYLSGSFDQVHSLVQEIEGNARELVDSTKALEIKIQALIAQNKASQAIDTALKSLQAVGIRLSKTPSKAAILTALIKTHILVQRKGIDQLAALPVMTDPKTLAAMQIMASVGSAVSRSAPTLFPVLICKLVQLSVRYGNAVASIPAYSGFGILQSAVLKNVKAGYRFGQLAEKLLISFNAKAVEAKTHIVVASFLDYWINPIKNSVSIAEKAYRAGMQNGDMEFAASGLMVANIHGYLAGEPLQQLAVSMESNSQAIRQLKQELLHKQHQLFHQAVENLMGEGALSSTLNGNRISEAELLTPAFIEQNQTAAYYAYLNKLILSYLSGNNEEARQYSTWLAGREECVMGTAIVPAYLFYDGLLHAACYTQLNKSERKKAQARLSKAIVRMKKWSQHAPANFEHKRALLQAELYRIQDKPLKARLEYENAVQGAYEHGYLQEEALTYELMGRFFRLQQKKELARLHLQKAYKVYCLWGARAKAEQLKQHYPDIYLQGAETPGEQSAIYQQGDSLDLEGVLDAAAALSSQVQLHKTVENLLKIVLQQAGAQEGYLLLETDDRLEVVAKGVAGKASIDLLPNVPVAEYKKLPASIINYTHRTQKELVLSDAQADKRFSSDPVVAIRHIRSVLAVPVVRQGNLIGIIYLHNMLASGAFSSRQMQILRLLSGQIAVSLENALLYGKMEGKIEERTRQISVQQQILEDKNKELEALNEEKDELVNIVAHDLRSPLNQIRGMLNLILLSPTNLTLDQRQFVDLSLKSADRLSEMIARILNTSAIETNHTPLNLEMLELDGLLDELVSNFQYQAAEKDILLHFIAPEEPIDIELDRNYTVQVMENLISNALKFSPTGSQVHVMLYADGDVARIEVKDQGPGISKKDQKRLFSKFQTLTARPTAGEDSTGLGLSIAKRFVEAMGGNIGCESEIGDGSTFYVEFVLV